MTFTRDVIEELIEAACDRCIFTFICSQEELDEHCDRCICEKTNNYIEEMILHGTK